MKKLVTQFDTINTSASVATPTCSSCCCCCCCLATALTSTSLLTRRVNQEIVNKKISSPWTLRIVAALFLPLTGVLSYAAYYLLNNGFQSCVTKTYSGDRYISSYTYNVCNSPANALIPFLIVGMLFLTLTYIYTRIKMSRPMGRGFLVAICISIAVVAEAFAGGFMILTGVGGIVYLVLVPFIAGIINAWYAKHLLYKQ